VLRGARDLRVEEVAEATPGLAGVVIEVEAAGVCGSDVAEWRRPGEVAGQVMGHEFAGVIVARGLDADPRLRVGDEVTALPLMPCEMCAACVVGEAHLCRGRVQIGLSGLAGAFADAVSVPYARLGRTVFALPPEVGGSGGALAEPVAVGLHATSKLGGEWLGAVAVIGAGMIGCVVVQLLALRGARVIVVEPSAARRGLALDLGADAVIEPHAAFSEALRDATGGAELDAVMECSGRPEMLAMALEAVRWGGTVVAVGQYPGGATLDPRVVMQHGVRLVGSFGGRARDCASALELMACGRVDAERLVDARFGLDAIGEAFEHAARADRGGVKVLVARDLGVA
jgi:threonine dehydrogenase-like Zn-dependent dehydrogenase